MSLLFDRDKVVGRKSGAMDADEVKSANGKVLKVGSLVVPMSFTDKENKRHLSRVVLKITPKGGGFGPYVYLKGGVAPYKPNDLYAFDGCEAAQDAAPFKVGDKVLRKGYPAPSPRDYYKVIEVHPNGGVMLDDGFNGYYNPNLIIRATDATDAAPFKVGDRVKTGRNNIAHPDKKGVVVAVGALEIDGSPSYQVKFDDGNTDRMNGSELTSAADASEGSIERKLSSVLGGDVTVANTHIYVDKSVQFDKAKAEIEKVARENGASVVKAYKAGFKDVWGFDLSKSISTDAAEGMDADEVKDGNGKPIRVGGKVQVEPSRGWHIKTPWGIAVGKVEKILPNGRVEVDFGQGDKTQIESTACVCVDAACDAELWQSDLRVGLKVKEAKSGRRGIVTRVDADGDPWVKFDNGSSGKVLLSSLVKDSAEGMDAFSFPMSEKASRIVKGIIPQIQRIRSEVESSIIAVERAHILGAEREALYRDRGGIDKILDALETAASFA